MTRFRFVAVTATNEREVGSRDAAAAADVVRELAQRGHTVIRIEPERLHSSLWQWLNADISLRGPISSSDLALLTQEWAGLIEAGVTVEETLALSSSARAKQKRMAKVVSAIRDEVKAGASFCAALRNQPNCFPAAYVAMIEAAEAAGNLGLTLRRLAQDLEARRAFVDKVRGALLYPIFLIVIASAVIVTLLVVVVPSLEALLQGRRATTLPITTQLVLGASNFLRAHGTFALALASIVIISTAGAFRIPRLRFLLDLMCLRSPILGDLLHVAQSSQFLRVLSGLVGGGVALPRALTLATRAVGNRAVRLQMQEVQRRVHVGSALGDALTQLNAVPADALTLARMGERTGRLAEALAQAAAILEARTRRRLEAIATLVGPVLTVVFGIVAGLIVYAMLSTILSLNDLAVQ